MPVHHASASRSRKNGQHGRSFFAEYSNLRGPDLIGRLEPFGDFFRDRSSDAAWFYTRSLGGPPRPCIDGRDESGRPLSGLNFGSQDYLSLTSHPAVYESALKALQDYGPHSAGSACAMGNTAVSEALEKELGMFLAQEHVLLFPTGWAAGYGSIAGLVRAEDHVVIDRLAHNCLQKGAQAATKNIHRMSHLDHDHARTILGKIRSEDSECGILIVTESLFSMHSDTPDLRRLQEIAHEYGATLLVDVAHDLGAMGENGLGALEEQAVLGEVDLVMGSFSKTFSSNGGFLASRSAAVKQYVKLFGNSHMFSNALSPVQTAVVRAALGIVTSEEGSALRLRLRAAIDALRDEFVQVGRPALGLPSPIVPVPVGDEGVARMVNAELPDSGIVAQMVEYPIVPQGEARARMQVMAGHTVEDARRAARAMDQVIRRVEATLATDDRR